MPVHVLSEGAGPGTCVPAHLTRIPIPLVAAGTDCSDKTVKGRVVCKGPLVSLAGDDFILKAVLREEDSQPSGSSQNPSINVVLFGALARDFSRAVNHGDVVVACGFSVTKSSTVDRDKLHSCSLLLSGDDACLYVSRPPPDPGSPPDNKRSAAPSAEVCRKAKVQRYSYVRLDQLKAGAVVNVYGVVVFFKQPFKSRGTDFCSSLKITDPSDQKITCTVFCEKLEDHPKIFQIGDIVRLHRVKAQSYKDSVMLVNTFGFSAVAFDGTPGGAVEPRTSSRSFHFDRDDRRTVEELRAWAAGRAPLPPGAAAPLSGVRPRAFFDLTCQLLAKAPVDSTCTLLRVWDGTRCPHVLQKVSVEPGVTEGPSSFPEEKEKLVADVLVFDNHVEVARQLQPGAFLRIYNLRATPGPGKEAEHLALHLHGGTAYGRGIRVLPENSADVQELRRTLEVFAEVELKDSAFLEVWSTPPESPGLLRLGPSGGETAACGSERRCAHAAQPATLAELRRSDPGRVRHRHVRVRLKSYEPRGLHQVLKLYCSECRTMLDVPDEELVSGLFSEASGDPAPCSPPPWALSGRVAVPGDSPGSSTRTLRVHLSTQLMSEGKTNELLFVVGSTLEEMRRLAAGYRNVVPVRSSGGRLALLDPPAPFLFRGGRRFYGCRRCSDAQVREPSAEGVEAVDEKIIAEALGVRPLRFVLLMKLELQDATDTLDVFLWRDAELFFGVSAEEAAANQEAQTSIRQTMDALCPPGGDAGERPWLNLCLAAYRAEDGEGRSQTCYQICHTAAVVTKPPSEQSELDPA